MPCSVDENKVPRSIRLHVILLVQGLPDKRRAQFAAATRAKTAVINASDT
jgi:hypothetical protein